MHWNLGSSSPIDSTSTPVADVGLPLRTRRPMSWFVHFLATLRV
jgi:hypothetical protein